MINLLPEEKKHQLRREYQLRRITVLLCVAAGIVLFVAGTLLPLYAVLGVRHEAALAAVETLVAKEEKERVAVRNVVREVSGQIAVLSEPKADTKIAFDLIPAILTTKGNVSVKGLSHQQLEGKTTVRLNGIAPRRDDFIGFLRALETSGMFSSVQSPVSNLVKDRDLVFSVELTLR